MTKYFATHLAPQGIGVNALSPGGVYNPNNPQIRNFWHTTNPGPLWPAWPTKKTLWVVRSSWRLKPRDTSVGNLVIDGGYSIW